MGDLLKNLYQEALSSLHWIGEETKLPTSIVSKLVGCLFIVVEGFWCYAPFPFYFLGGLLLSTGWTCGRTLPYLFTCIFFSVVCFFEFSKKHWFWYFKYFRIREPSVPVL
jgi:hypothetical protein